jgi:16S rRNA C967 or C1407 C5-methylase (RsmB/RsmF family)
MVYSTCSLNPVENESVVANLLLKFKGQLELVDARDKLVGLKTVNGFHTWKLMSKDGEFYEKLEEVNEKYKYLIREYMFPPSLEVAQELKLEKW